MLRAQFTWPDDDSVSLLARDLVGKLLERDPKRRLTAEEALRHPWIVRTMQGIDLGKH